MRPFDYMAPPTLQAALALLQAKGSRARALSGGTDLIVQVREDRRHPETIIDIKKIPELMEIKYDAVQGLLLGASVPCHRIYEDPRIQKAYPGLIDAASLIGGIQIQSRASLGGNLCNSSPAADSIPALMVHEATCLIAGSQGSRTVPVEEFCTGPGKNVLDPTELLVALKIPAPPKHFGASYLRFIPRNEMDIAVVGCGASVELSDDRRSFVRARIALGAVAPTPLLVKEAGALLAGKKISDDIIEQAASLAQAAARPITDMRGTAEYRRHLVGVLTRRALHNAVQRAKGE
ncbi:MAG: xanthine dehydrogenase family protein subunit M [Terriglobia bacterium]